VKKFSVEKFLKRVMFKSFAHIFEDDSITKHQFDVTVAVVVSAALTKKTHLSQLKYYSSEWATFSRNEFCAMITHSHFDYNAATKVIGLLNAPDYRLFNLLVNKQLLDQCDDLIKQREQYLKSKNCVHLVQRSTTYKRSSVKRDLFLKECELATQAIEKDPTALVLLLTSDKKFIRDVTNQIREVSNRGEDQSEQGEQ
jgi:hypothetical protein